MAAPVIDRTLIHRHATCPQCGTKTLLLVEMHWKTTLTYCPGCDYRSTVMQLGEPASESEIEAHLLFK